jgi:uncharacterized membrane protein
MLVRLAQGLYILLFALVAGVMWGTWLALGRTMTQFDAASFLADGHHMIPNLAPVMPVLMISTAVLGLLVTVVLFRRRSRAAAWLALIGLLLLGSVIAVTLSVNVPIDNEIKTWTPTTLPPDWESTRARWAELHTLRTFLSLAGLTAAIASLIPVGSAEWRANAQREVSQPAATAMSR